MLDIKFLFGSLSLSQPNHGMSCTVVLMKKEVGSIALCRKLVRAFKKI